MMKLTMETLRREFDASFAAPARQASSDEMAYLTIRVGSRPYALPLSELSAIASQQRITRVPSPDRELLGLTAVRGRSVPVFDLALLLGEAEDEHLRWVVLSQGAQPIGLAFASLEGHLHVQSHDLETVSHTGNQLIGQVIRAVPENRPIILVSAVALHLLARARGKREKNNG